MVGLTFYGGVNEIGGNKILLEDGGHKLFLDFGFPYKRYKLFYEEYLKPRGGAGLLDFLTLGLLPPLEGIYRGDIEVSGLWKQFLNAPYYRKLGEAEGVLLSHAHLDHSGHISFFKESIPVYSTVTTAFIAKAIQDSGKFDFDKQVCYFNPVEWGAPSDWKQGAFLAGSEAKQQRQFCIADAKPESLSPAAEQFWNWGFWEKKARQKELVSCPLTSHSQCSFNLHCFPVDHSIPGACAWGIETSSGWVIYSGDLRLHGRRAELTRGFIEKASSLKPRILILEGTNVNRQINTSEQEVYENGLKTISGAKSLVIADFSPRDVDRLLTFLQIARQTGRKLAILPRDAYLLKTMRLLDEKVPDISQDDTFTIYQDTVAGKFPSLWMRNICREYDSKIVLADDVRSAQDQFILCFSFFDLNELPSICPEKGGLYVFSSSEPHDEEQEIDFRRLHNWLAHFEFKSFGLPVEKNGDWLIPEDERGLHASGHACGTDLLNIARQISPRILLPVHSEDPGFYFKHLSGSGIEVMLPVLGQVVEIN